SGQKHEPGTNPNDIDTLFKFCSCIYTHTWIKDKHGLDVRCLRNSCPNAIYPLLEQETERRDQIWVNTSERCVGAKVHKIRKIVARVLAKQCPDGQRFKKRLLCVKGKLLHKVEEVTDLSGIS